MLRHELGLHSDARAAVTGEFLERAGATAQVFAPDDLGALPASGSSGPDAVVICPCSMSTAAHIALGATTTLMQRAADVALKERRQLVVVPARDAAHADPPAAAARARGGGRRRPPGHARLLLPARRRSRTPSTTSRARCMTRARLRTGPLPPVGRGQVLWVPSVRQVPATCPSIATRRASKRCSAASPRRYDLMNRLMTAGLDGRWRRMAAEQAAPHARRRGAGRLLWDRRPHVQPVRGLSLLRRDRARLHSGDARAGAREGGGAGAAIAVCPCRASSSPAMCSRCPSTTRASPPSPLAGACATCPTSRGPSPRWRASPAPEVGWSASSRPGRPTAWASASTTSGWATSCPCWAARHRRRLRLRLPAGVRRRVPARRRARGDHGGRRADERPLPAPGLRRRRPARRRGTGRPS